jgi:hypothetical protein
MYAFAYMNLCIYTCTQMFYLYGYCGTTGEAWRVYACRLYEARVLRRGLDDPIPSRGKERRMRWDD